MESSSEPPAKRMAVEHVGDINGAPVERKWLPWLPCKGCDRVSAQQPLREEAFGEPKYYSTTHCCRACERGEAHELAPEDPYQCVGIPATWIRSVKFEGSDKPAHFICHVPAAHSTSENNVENGSDKLLPVFLYLHGAVTYLYPETLWPEVRDIVDKNAVAREQFILVAAVGSIGEPIVLPNEWRMKQDRCGDEIPYVQKFDAEKLWAAFQALCASPISPRIRADMSRLSVMGYSMGGQAAWDIARCHGHALASVCPFACASVWEENVWDQTTSIKDNLMHLALRQYSGEADWKAYSWDDFMWIGRFRGLQLQEERAIEASNGISARSYCWEKNTENAGGAPTGSDGSAWCASDAPLQLNLMNGTRTAHCCWEEVLHDESAFGLFGWLLNQRRHNR